LAQVLGSSPVLQVSSVVLLCHQVSCSFMFCADAASMLHNLQFGI